LTTLFGPDIAELAASLTDTGAMDRLRSFRIDGTIVVVPVAGVVGEIESNGRIRVDGGAPGSAGGPIITGARLQQLSTVLKPPSLFELPADIMAGGEMSIDEFLADLQARFDEGLGAPLDLGDLGDFGDITAIGDQLLTEEFFRDLQRRVLDDFPVPTDGGDTASRTIDQLVFGTRDAGGVDVIVAASTDGIDRTIDRLRGALWAAVPIAMLLTGLVTWLLAGRALRPVRTITEHTGRIRAGTLHERVPVPAGNDEIAGLATEMNDMLDRLHHDDRRRRQFVADASHELRSPIASIHTQAEVALAHSSDEAVAELAAGVLAEAERLGTIVDDLLALARHDETLVPPGTLVDLDDIVIAAAARPRRVQIDTRRVSGGRVRGRPDELTRAVTHLLDNAARHAGSTVRVSLTTRADVVELAIDDDGPGVPRSDRERVFERFVRLDEARIRDDGGAGLGLAVVSTVVSAAGGRVHVEDSDLGGARFVAAFPNAA
jgi:signal transduction histidine kinase